MQHCLYETVDACANLPDTNTVFCTVILFICSLVMSVPPGSVAAIVLTPTNCSCKLVRIIVLRIASSCICHTSLVESMCSVSSRRWLSKVLTRASKARSNLCASCMCRVHTPCCLVRFWSSLRHIKDSSFSFSATCDTPYNVTPGCTSDLARQKYVACTRHLYQVCS
jgi:hypothetical protein